MPETKTLIWVALAAMAPGTARPISFLISGVSRGQRMSTLAPDLRTPHPPALVGQSFPQRQGKRAYRLQIRNPLTVERFSQLPPTPRRFAQPRHRRGQRFGIHSKQGPLASLGLSVGV